MNSAYTNPGGYQCMYCGTNHSSKIECRLHCGICGNHGIPYTFGSMTVSRCFVHRPINEWVPQPCPPPIVTTAYMTMKRSVSEESKKLIDTLFSSLAHHCCECKNAATRMVYWKDCTRTFAYCDDCCALKSSFIYLGEKELEQAKIVRKANELLKENS